MKEYLVSEAIFIDYSGSPVPTGELPLKLSLERPWARLSTGLSLATSLALAACGGTPGPSSKEAQPQASSSGESIKPSLESARNITPPAPTPKPPESARPAWLPTPTPTRESVKIDQIKPTPTPSFNPYELLPTQEFKTRKSDTLGYQIDHPISWRFYNDPAVFPREGKEAYTVNKIPTNIGEPIAYLILNSYKPSSSSPYGSFEAQEKTLKSAAAEFHRLWQERSESRGIATVKLLPKYLDGYDVWRLDVFHPGHMRPAPVYESWITTFRNEFAWWIKLTASPGGWITETESRRKFFSNADAVFDKMLRSFKFTR